MPDVVRAHLAVSLSRGVTSGGSVSVVAGSINARSGRSDG